MIGKAPFTSGQVAGKLAVDASGLTVQPCETPHVRGSTPGPLQWEYLLGVPVADGSLVETVEAVDVLHFRYSPDPATPCAGVSPLRGCGLDATNLSKFAYRAGQEAAQPWGTLSALPRGSSTGGPEACNPEQAQAMGQLLNGTNGATVVTGGGSFSAQRLGFNPPQAAATWSDASERKIMNAAGLAPSLRLGSDGTGAREGFRRFTNLVASNLGQIVEAEATRKLEVSVSIGFERLRGSDSQAIGRALKSMVDAGVPLADALVQVGLGDANSLP